MGRPKYFTRPFGPVEHTVGPAEQRLASRPRQTTASPFIPPVGTEWGGRNALKRFSVQLARAPTRQTLQFRQSVHGDLLRTPIGETRTVRPIKLRGPPLETRAAGQWKTRVGSPTRADSTGSQRPGIKCTLKPYPLSLWISRLRVSGFGNRARDRRFTDRFFDQTP